MCGANPKLKLRSWLMAALVCGLVAGPAAETSANPWQPELPVLVEAPCPFSTFGVDGVVCGRIEVPLYHRGGPWRRHLGRRVRAGRQGGERWREHPGPGPRPVRPGIRRRGRIHGSPAWPHLDQQRTITLSVAILPASGPDVAPDPLVMFTGGPGGNVFGLAGLVLYGFAAPLREDREVVLISERGSYGAEPLLDCPELAQVDALFPATEAETDAARLAAFEACRDRLRSEGVDLRAFTNRARAADMAFVLEALGYDEYNLWGVSGGAMLALYMTREYNDRVRTVITDSGAFPHAHFRVVFETLFENVSARFSRLFDECAQDAYCDARYPELEEVFTELIAELNAAPVSLPLRHPTTGALVDLPVTGDMVVRALTNSFDAVSRMPLAIQNASDGNFSLLSWALSGNLVNDTGPSFADAYYKSVACSELVGLKMERIPTQDARPEVVQALAPTVQSFLDVCEIWDAPRVPRGRRVASKDTPIMLLEGVYDANRPPELAWEVAERFSISHVVEFGNAAHVVLGPCAVDLMVQFMRSPGLAPDQSCVAMDVVFF